MQAPAPPAASLAPPEPRGPAAWSAAERDMGLTDGGSVHVTEDRSELTCHSGGRAAAVHAVSLFTSSLVASGLQELEQVVQDHWV